MVANAFCKQCGSELPQGQVFCTACGAKGGEVESATNKGTDVIAIGANSGGIGVLFVLFAILKWLALALGFILFITMADAAKSTMQETTAAVTGCFCVLLAVFFHLEQHKS